MSKTMNMVGNVADSYRTVAFALDRLKELMEIGNGNSRTRYAGLKRWFTEAKLMEVDTVQVQYPGRVWMPGGRVVEEVRSTFAVLDGSRIDFAGCRTVYASPTEIVVTYDWGEHEAVVMYSVAG